MKNFALLFLIFNCIFFTCNTFAQSADSLTNANEKVKDNYVLRMQRFAQNSAKESQDDFNADKAIIAQTRILEEIKKVMQRAKSHTINGPDTSAAKIQLAQIEKDYNTAVDGVLINMGR